MVLRPLPFSLALTLTACGASDPSPPLDAAPALDALDTGGDSASGCARDDGLPVAPSCNGFACVLLNTPGNCGACGVACGDDELCGRRDGAFRCVAR